MKWSVWLSALALLVGACNVSDSTSTPPGVVSTTADTPVTTTTVGSAPTSSPAPSTTVAALQISLDGTNLVYSRDGAVMISGWVDSPADVTVDGTPVPTPARTGGRATFDVEIMLATGEHEVDITARGPSGVQATESVQVIVDPDLDEELAYVHDIDPGAGTLVADYVQWLTGDEALAAAREDGHISDDEELPGDFYIRNENPRLRTLSLADDLEVVLNACYPDEGPCVVRVPVDFNAWDQLTSQPESALESMGWNWYGLAELPYWLTLRDGVVVQVVEQYLP